MASTKRPSLRKNDRVRVENAGASHSTTNKSRAQLDHEIAEVLRGPRRIAHIGFGEAPSSKLPTPPRFAERMAEMQYKPTRAQRHDPTLPKGEKFTVLAARTLKQLGSSSTIEGAMQKAPPKGDVLVRGEYTSDGHHWGLGKGRLVAQRENGRWLRG